MSYGFHLLSLPQFIFCSSANADVPKDHRVERFRSRFHLRDRRFDWKFFSIGSDAHECSRRVHRATGNASLPETPNVFPMSLTEFLWNELIDGLPKGIFSRAAEDLFCGPVEHDDPLVIIYRNDGVHRGTDDAQQSLLAISKSFVSPLVLGNIHDRTFESARLIVGR